MTPLPLRGTSSLRLAWQVQIPYRPLLCWLLLPSARQKALFLHPGLLWELHTAHSNMHRTVLHHIHPKLARRGPVS